MNYPPQHPHQLEPNDDAALDLFRDRLGRQVADDVEGTLAAAYDDEQERAAGARFGRGLAYGLAFAGVLYAVTAALVVALFKVAS